MALLRPKAGVFVSSIKYLLAIITASEVTLLGVSFGDASDPRAPTAISGAPISSCPNPGDLVLHRTGLHFPTDEINMLAMAGTRTGRIFAGGQDGHLYEFTYQAEEGWFTRKCRKLNRTCTTLSYFAPTFLRLGGHDAAILSLAYDPDRNLLHALLSDSTIQCYYLGHDDGSFSRLCHFKDVFEHAARLCPTGLINKKNFKVISIHVVAPEDSAYIHLIAMTSAGVKLYFTTLRRDERAYSRGQLLRSHPAPYTLELVHVRLPAEEIRKGDHRRLIHSWYPNIHSAYYRHGVMLASSTASEHEDYLLISAINQAVVSAGHKPVPLESISDLAIEGKVWDIAEARASGPAPVESTISTVFRQVFLPFEGRPRSFLVLTNAGVYVVEKGSALSELERILTTCNGHLEAEALAQFFEAYTAEQACFMCIVLACSAKNASVRALDALGGGRRPARDLAPMVASNLSLWALHAMIRYGGRAQILSIPAVEEDLFVSGASQFRLPSSGAKFEVDHSPLHRGLYLYFSRLVSSFWNEPILKFSEPSPQIPLTLHAFAEFLRANFSLLTQRPPQTTTRDHHHRHPLAATDGDAQHKLDELVRAEEQSIRNLISLLDLTLQLLAFLSICRDYNVLEAALGSSRDLDSVDFEEMLASLRGRDLVANIGAALVQRQLRLKSSVDALCQILLQRCPSFFGESEIVVYQGSEALERAGLTHDAYERNGHLQESLKLFLQGAASISLTVMSEIAERYKRLAFFPGIVQLGLSVAAAHDRESVALMAAQNPRMQLSTMQQEVVNLRDSLYGIVLDALKVVHGLEPQSISSHLGNIDMESLQRETFSRVLNAKDELFHQRFYEWLISERLGHLLLGVETPYIVPFLQGKLASNDPLGREYLWKYLARHGHFVEAAKILDQLASSPESGLVLVERIERLSLAFANARSVSGGSLETSEYVRELKERLDVAKAQHDLQEAILAQYGQVAEVYELDSALFDVSELFNRFSRPLKLWECSLRLIHMSSYQDPLLVHQLWSSIIGKYFGSREAAGQLFPQKLAELAKLLYPSSFAFPLDFILDSVMLASKKHSQSPDWVASTLFNVGIPPIILLRQLKELFEFTSSYWCQQANFEYAHQVFQALCSRILSGSFAPAIVAEAKELSTALDKRPHIQAALLKGQDSRGPA